MPDTCGTVSGSLEDKERSVVSLNITLIPAALNVHVLQYTLVLLYNID